MRRTSSLLILPILVLLSGLEMAAQDRTIITTVAGGGPNNLPAVSANIAGPRAVAKDSAGNLFVAAQDQNRVFKLDISGQFSVVAGTGLPGFSGDGGAATNARLRKPAGVAVDSFGNLYIADTGNQRIRRVDATTHTITTVAGNGNPGFSGDGLTATSASLNFPAGVGVDSFGNLYIADSGNHRIRRVAPGADGQVTGALDETITTVAGNGFATFSGDNGSATSGSLNFPAGVGVDSFGNLYIADRKNHRIRRVAPGADGQVTGALDETITTVAGNGNAGFSGDGLLAISASLNSPAGVAADSLGNLYIADRKNRSIRRVAPGADGQVTGALDETITTVAGDGSFGFSGDGLAATSARLSHPVGVAVDSNGSLFTADSLNNRIRRVQSVPFAIQELIGDVVALNLKQGISNSLDSKLNAALHVLGDMNENNNIAAINALQAFINAVKAQRGVHIPTADADSLIAAAQAIIASLGD